MATRKKTTAKKAETPKKAKPKMSDQLRKYRGSYKQYVSGDKHSLDNADDVALLLRPLEPMRVKRVAEKLLNVDLSQYDHLNNGQIRMNSGNRIRNAVKRGTISIPAVKKVINATS
jgi:hypothetical protein